MSVVAVQSAVRVDAGAQQLLAATTQVPQQPASGVVALSRRHHQAGAWLLAAYSASGLVGIGHYLVDGATQTAWWWRLHVCADISCGVAVLALAARILLRRPRLPLVDADRDVRSIREVGGP